MCLAGATFARFGVGPGETTSPDGLHKQGRINGDEYGILRALDELRNGSVRAAFHWWEGGGSTRKKMTQAMWDAVKRVDEQTDDILDDPKIQGLTDWPRARKAYLELAGALEGEGL